MYLYVSEIFPTEIRPIGMGFSLFGQFACKQILERPSLTRMRNRFTNDCTATIILLQTAPIGFATVGWKYYLVIICWSIFFIPGTLESPLSLTFNPLTVTIKIIKSREEEEY